jgi:signal transduction histidine kinase
MEGLMTVASITNILESSPESWHQAGEVVSANNAACIHLSAADHCTHIVQKFAALGEMTGGIAHDFRNILAVIDASLRLAERNLERPETVQSYLTTAHEAVLRGGKLTTQLITFAKRPELEVCSGDANECLSSLEPLLRYSVGPQNPIVLDLQKNLPGCLINRTQFEVAVLNLVNNSRDAMSTAGGEIRITTELYPLESHSYVRVRVEDHGSGMSPDVLKQIFDPFFTTKGEKGSGIGLPQVHAIMKLVGGYMTVASELGRGTVVDLMFPAIASITVPVEFRGGLGQSP